MWRRRVLTKGLAESSTSVRAVSTERLSEGTPKDGAHLLAVCATPGQLEYSVALALQQHGQQSALRKRKGRG